jgi:NADH-quinone oxidoreductase subunit L
MGMVVAWLAISGIPPLSGFFSKDEIITEVFLAHDYGLWVIALVAAIFTGLYMTRLIFLTFYGNERWQSVPAPALPVVSGGSDDTLVDASDEAERRGDADSELDSEPSPTVGYGEPIRYPEHPLPPHESPGTMTGPILALAALAALIGFINMPFDGLDFFDEWLEPSFRGMEFHEPSSFLQGAALEVLAVILAVVGISIAYLLYRRGLDDPDRDPLNERLGAAAPVLGHAYYFDYGISRLVDGPIRAFARFLDRVVDQKIIDGAVDGVGKLVRAAARGLRHVQDGFVRRYALGIACGAAALLLYVLVWAGR